ncbi:MAG: hypothetical protein JSS54_07090 [Proteobacteria bacterium]|nr:hypothetical protein [Pseudomonadota bacterium]MBS0268727.1 hypothetical protein [Pseudomonadota bacterium]
MGDHFWPAMYPGLIVGILYGLSLRGVFNTAVAALGGLVGAAIAYEILLAVDLNDGLPSVAGLIAAAFVGAYLFTSIAQRLAGARPKT